MPRTAEIARQTKETDIKVYINLDGKGDNPLKYAENSLQLISSSWVANRIPY